ncbi:MAG: hypothetical protein AAF821_18220 [Cyanobacteria bacterium P01_D01_bin.156]
MTGQDYISFQAFYVDLTVDFDSGITAILGFNPRRNRYSVFVGNYSERFLYSDDIMGPIYGFEAMFQALHEKLDELGLEGFPRDPEYVLDRLKNPPPQIVDLEMTDEEYLAQLAAKSTVR